MKKKKESFAKLQPVKLGLACGIITGIFIALTTIAGLFGYYHILTTLISDIYGSLGYSVSGLGILLGAIYGFIDGFIATWLFALIYNKLL